MKTIVITGSTRGIGYGLAEAFLELDCAVVISGRTTESVFEIVEKLSRRFDRERVYGFACDVRQYEQVQALWDAARQVYSKVDIWVNNAGVANPLGSFSEQPEELIDDVLSTNLTGAMYGAKVALHGMQPQGYGAVYTLLGLGSDGRKQAGLTLYGTTKAALRYFSEALAQETRGTGLLVGCVSPGMVVTDLVTSSRYSDAHTWERVKRVLNLLGDRVETVSPWLAKRMLQNKKNGARIQWLTTSRLLWRVLTSPIIRRKIVK